MLAFGITLILEKLAVKYLQIDKLITNRYLSCGWRFSKFINENGKILSALVLEDTLCPDLENF